jgi:glycosyltransferase involved in cell wall biosynthesis
LTPFFTIAVTAYNRRDLLRQTLSSILNQSFGDFEVIIGNDYVEEPLLLEALGFDDPRIRIVNNSENLGELGNMNALLSMSQGKYFALIADDDLYAPDFLKAAHAAIQRFDFPPCVYTSFIDGSEIPPDTYDLDRQTSLLSGSEFVNLYFEQKLKALGNMGVFDREYLISVNGFENVNNGAIALYMEYLQIVKAALIDRVAYVNAPLIVYRVHEGSWGFTNREHAQYLVAGENLVRRSIDYFQQPELRAHFKTNLKALLKFVMSDYVIVTRRSEGFDARKLMAYFRQSKRYIQSLKSSELYTSGRIALLQAQMWLAWVLLKHKILTIAPHFLIVAFYSVRAFIHREPMNTRSLKFESR